jgi:xylulokinase
MTKTYVIGIDSSTTACKAIAWDPTGSEIAEGRASYPLLQPEPTWYEQNAEQCGGIVLPFKDLFQ